jgi:hypothetical protein
MILVDGRQELAHARDLCRLLRTTGTDCPVVLVATEGGLAVVAHDWGMDEVVLHTCGPAELEARIRLAIGRLHAARDDDEPDAHVIRTGEVVVDDATYTATVGSRPLDLTFKEFVLLVLAQHPDVQPPAALQEGLRLSAAPAPSASTCAAARQARAGQRDPDRHGPQRRLPLRGPGQGAQGTPSQGRHRGL